MGARQHARLRRKHEREAYARGHHGRLLVFLERAHDEIGGKLVVSAQPLGVGRHLSPRLDHGQPGQRGRPLGMGSEVLGSSISGGGGGGGGGQALLNMGCGVCGRQLGAPAAVVDEEAANDEPRPLARERGQGDGQLIADELQRAEALGRQGAQHGLRSVGPAARRLGAQPERRAQQDEDHVEQRLGVARRL